MNARLLLQVRFGRMVGVFWINHNPRTQLKSIGPEIKFWELVAIAPCHCATRWLLVHIWFKMIFALGFLRSAWRDFGRWHWIREDHHHLGPDGPPSMPWAPQSHCCAEATPLGVAGHANHDATQPLATMAGVETSLHETQKTHRDSRHFWNSKEFQPHQFIKFNNWLQWKLIACHAFKFPVSACNVWVSHTWHNWTL